MNNKKRLKEINDFLLFFKKVLEKNKNYTLTQDFVYHQFTRYQLDQKEASFNVSKECFNNWIQRFRSNPNIQALVSKDWSYFCQFIPADREDWTKIKNQDFQIKLYFPLDSEHLYEGANQLFDFIAANKIPHLSKIGSDIRTDNIVVRVMNEKDAEKIINFVKQNRYIQEGLLKSNPLVPQEDNIAFTSDGSISYNQTVAALVKQYLNQKNQERKLRKVSVEDFKEYVKGIKESLLKDHLSPEELLEKNEMFSETGMFYLIDTEEDIKGLFCVLDILEQSLEKEYTKEDYYNYFNGLERQIKRQQVYDQDTILLLKKGFRVLSEKYGTKEDAYQQIKGYLKTGDLMYITSKENLRDDYRNNDMQNRLSEYLQRNGLTLEQLKNRLTGGKQQIENAASYLRFIWTIQSEKYENETAFYNICSYISTGDDAHLTRDYNIREIVSNSDLRERILNYLKANNISINDFVFQISGNKKTQEEYLRDACLTTYLKYEEKYNKGEDEAGGIDWAACALRELILVGKYDGFTRDMNVRDKLIAMVPREDAIRIISDKMNISENKILDMNWEEMKEFLEKYIREITQIQKGNIIK